mmetsp:Transcript_30453/g.34873  ORF Transcript_30453/g.34873 Transcript_30453/m.34873 type:complete len:162 (-) Transcript_30453:67-552(-)
MSIEYKVKSQEELKEAIGAGARGGSSNPNLDKAKEFFGELWTGTKNVTSKGLNLAGQGVKKVGGKIEETGITEKVSSGAKVVGNKTVEYGGIAYNKTKEGIIKIATNEKVQEIGSKTVNGVKEAGKSVWGFLSKTFGKDDGNGAEGSGDAVGRPGGDAATY